MVDVAILGASGYGGGELIRRLARHPEVRVALAVSKTYAGQSLSAGFAGMAGRIPLEFAAEATPEQLAACPIVFLARDNGVAMREAPAIVAAGSRVIDLSADFRFRDPAVYEKWYGKAHAAPEACPDAVYGMPELHDEAICTARIVGNPGCYTTAAILSMVPLLAEGLIDPASIIIDAKSGVSGAGRSKFGPGTHFAEINESVSAYGVGGTHRHTPEIEQELSAIAGKPVTVTFTPHLIPMTRGILATCYATPVRPVQLASLRKMIGYYYDGAPFVHVSEGLPSSKHTAGTNMIHIGAALDERANRIIIVAAIDNLGKGQAGQAIQNMNLMLGFEQTMGLEDAGIWP